MLNCRCWNETVFSFKSKCSRRVLHHTFCKSPSATEHGFIRFIRFKCWPYYLFMRTLWCTEIHYVLLAKKKKTTNDKTNKEQLNRAFRLVIEIRFETLCKRGSAILILKKSFVLFLIKIVWSYRVASAQTL